MCASEYKFPNTTWLMHLNIYLGWVLPPRDDLLLELIRIYKVTKFKEHFLLRFAEQVLQITWELMFVIKKISEPKRDYMLMCFLVETSKLESI